MHGSGSGYSISPPATSIDYDILRAKILSLSEEYDIREIAFDPYNATETSVWMQANGFVCSPLRQHMGTLAGPTKKLMELILKHDLTHLDNPVLGWMASNCVADMDAAGSVKIDKARSPEKIDGIAALVNALSRAMLVNIVPKQSFQPFFI